VTGIVLQARLGSTRLARKVLAPLGGATLIDQVMARLNLVAADIRILATDADSAEALRPAASRNSFELLVGPAEDVLARYCLAIRAFGLDTVLRATGDNPLVSHEMANRLVECSSSRGVDYRAFAGLPLGMGVEYVSSRALLRAEAEARSPSEREHVCPFLYGHPEIFAVDRPPAPREFEAGDLRVTVDTREDYEAMLRIYGALYDGSPIPSLAVLAFLRGEGRTP